jgi:hypothetical protein
MKRTIPTVRLAALSMALFALFAHAAPSVAGYTIRIPAGAPNSAATRVASGTFALTTDIAGASGRASTFTLDAGCAAALGNATSRTLRLDGGASVSTGMTYDATTRTLTATLPAGGNGRVANLTLVNNDNGAYCTGSAKVYSAAGWWPIVLTTSRGTGGLPRATSASSTGFSATRPSACDSPVVDASNNNYYFSLSGSATYAAHTGSTTVCLESTPELAHAFNYTGVNWPATWSPLGYNLTNISKATLDVNGVLLAFDDPWTRKLYFVLAEVAHSAYQATGAVTGGSWAAVNPPYMTYYQGRSWAGLLATYPGHTTADAPAGTNVPSYIPLIRPLYTYINTWSYPLVSSSDPEHGSASATVTATP